MEIVNILMALVCMALPMIIAWVIVNHLAAKDTPKHERKSSQ